MGFFSGIMSLTASDLGKQAAKSAFGSLFGSPFRYVGTLTINAIFGNAQSEQLEAILSKLQDIDNDIKMGFTQINMTVEEEHLSDASSDIDSNFRNFTDTLKSESDLLTAFSKLCNNYYTTAVTTQVVADAEKIRNNLCADKGITNIYPKEVAEYLYEQSDDIYAFNERMMDVACRYEFRLVQAMLILTAVSIAGETDDIRNNASQEIENLRQFGSDIEESLNKFLRDIPNIVDRNAAKQFLIQNKATNQVMGRYAQLHSGDALYHCHFALHDHGDGYYYLKISDKDIGIDHWDGEKIKPIGKADSGHPNHIWKFEAVDRWFRIVNKATGKALDHFYGESIHASDATDHPNRLWEVLPGKDGNTCTIANKATGALLGYDIEHNNINAFSGEFVVDAGTHNPDFFLPGG